MLLRREGRWSVEDRAESVWHELAFDVGRSVTGLRITLDHDRAHGSSGVLDLGLVDSVGWRGWSGGARRVVEVGPESSSPGYHPRGLPEGEWRVVVGLHRVPVTGLDFTVTVEDVAVDPPAAEATPPVPAGHRRPRRELPTVNGMTWLAGDCHAHTVHSDGSLTPDGLAARAVEAGLDFLWVTDHNTTSHHALLPDVGRRHGVALLPGQEVTTADGHANAFGDIGWVDFRRPAQTWLDEVAARDGVLSVNHPIGDDCAWRHPLDRPLAMAEVWHSSWRVPTDGGALAWWTSRGWPTAIGGSDFHRPGAGVDVGAPTTWVLCADGDVLGGMRRGRVAVSAGRDAPVLLRLGDEWVAVDAEDTQLVCPDGRRTPVRATRESFTGHDGPHLLERHDRAIVSIAS